MKNRFTKIAMALSAAALCVGCSSAPKMPTADEVMTAATRVADWQIEHFEDQADFRARRTEHKPEHLKKYHDLVWHNGAFYAGLYEFTKIAESDKYVNWLNAMGDEHSWHLHERLFHADDHAVGQFYLNMARQFGKEYMYEPTQARFEEVMSSEEVNDWHWTWCDALFMAPPVWTRLAQITGDSKYLDYMDEQYHMTYDILWDSEARLFFRDTNYLTKTEANGEKLFWSRGNGWVFGGLALMIPDFPAGWSGTDFYVTLFKEMALTLKEIQREDGTWSAGLLGGVEAYEAIETSGTSFFTYGLAWGINNGLLDRETYEPVLLKAWHALVGAINEDGMLTYVQGVAAAPGGSTAEYTEVYGSGAFLAAAAEMYKYANKFGAM